jgi:putative phosphoribosyl transferase
MGADGEVVICERLAFSMLNGPWDPQGVVVFANGSDSNRHSPRNPFAAARIHESGFSTLLFDLLSETEAADRGHVFDIALLGQRVCEAIDWLDGL